MRPHLRTLALAALLGLVGAAGALAQPLAAREVIEALAAERSLLTPLVVLVGSWSERGRLGDPLLAAGAQLGADRPRRAARARCAAAATAAGGVRCAGSGQPGLAATSDSTLLGSVSSTALVQSLNGTVSLVGAIALMAVVDVVLLVVTLAVLVVVGVAAAIAMPRIGRATERQQAAVGEHGAVLERAWGAAHGQGERR